MSANLILARLAASDPGNDPAPLRELVTALRPQAADDVDEATRNLQALCHVLDNNPEQARALRMYLDRVISSRKLSHLLTETGITLSIGFWGAVWHRLSHRWLPPVARDEYFKDVFGKIFYRTDDYRWVCGVDDAVWISVAQAIEFQHGEAALLHAQLRKELLGAIQVLSYRISAIGLESELVRNYPAIEDYESPFLRQNAELNDYISAYENWLTDPGVVREDSLHLEVLLTQCEEIVSKIRRVSTVHGISISLTRLLLRLTQSIDRLRALLALLDASQANDAIPAAVRLFKELVTADNRRYNLPDLVETNTELLAQQITENASRTGEHYIAENRSEYAAMLRSAAGAGFIIGFMAMLKIFASYLRAAPLVDAFLFSLNYSLGFMLIHVLHFTVATKQPAMTAALMALAIDRSKQKLDELAELAVRIMRSQFIAIVGNVALAMPVAYLIAWMWGLLTGQPLADPDKAQHLLHDLDPIHSLAIPHAAIGGVCLFLAGLISGYYDNKAAYSNIAARLRQLNWLGRLLGKARLRRIANYIGDNLGALAGNFLFGVMIGSVGTLGFFFGLPLEIRHITLSSANFVFALVGLGNQLSVAQWMLSLSGLALIALTNLAVSFALALTVALRSRRVNLNQEWSVAGILWRRFWSAPRDFFLPPPEPPPQAPARAPIGCRRNRLLPSTVLPGNDQRRAR